MMHFRNASIGNWLLAEGEVVCKLAQLNGANAFSLTSGKLSYVEPLLKVEYTSTPIHPELRHRVNPSVETIRLWGDHTWTKD